MTKDRRQRKGCSARSSFFPRFILELRNYSLEINSHTRRSADDLKSKSSPIQAVYSAIAFSWLGPPLRLEGFFPASLQFLKGAVSQMKRFLATLTLQTISIHELLFRKNKTKKKTTKQKNAFESRPRKKKNTVSVTKQLEHSQPSNFFPRCYIIQSSS